MYFTNDLSMIDHDAKDPNTLRFKKMKTSIVQRKRTIKYWFRVCGRWFAARAAQFSMVLCHETRNMESDNTAMIYFIKFFHLQQAFFVSERKKKTGEDPDRRESRVRRHPPHPPWIFFLREADTTVHLTTAKIWFSQLQKYDDSFFFFLFYSSIQSKWF